MRRFLTAALVAASLVTLAYAQDGPLDRAGQALDNAGKNIRYRVESEIARGQISAQEREVLSRVMRRIEWDKRFVGSALQFEARSGGTVVLRGSVLNDSVKHTAVDLVANTLGVTTVVDELAVVKEVKVIKSQPDVRVIESTPAGTTETRVIVPGKTQVIVKP
jgi:osmotically-inducible protein OsmY